MQVAVEDLDRQRTPLQVAEQPIDDLQRAAPAIARVAKLGERTVPSFEVGGGNVVEHELTLEQMPAREAILDLPLTGQKPIERTVELILISTRDRELIRKRGQ